MKLSKPATPPKKFYKIGEVMKHSGISRQTLHNYTMLGLIHACERTDSGHRLYPEDVFERLRMIALLKVHRSLTEVKEEMDARFGPPSADSGEDSGVQGGDGPGA